MDQAACVVLEEIEPVLAQFDHESNFEGQEVHYNSWSDLMWEYELEGHGAD